jgi:hypothetical protein
MRESAEMTQQFKLVTHTLSILLIPLTLGVLISSQNGLVKTASSVLFLTAYISMLYGIAGGFDWKLEEISRLRLFLFLLFSGFGFGLFLYVIWYVIRRFTSSFLVSLSKPVKANYFQVSGLNRTRGVNECFQIKVLQNKLFEPSAVSFEHSAL